MTTFDQLIKHRRDFEPCQFAELSEHPCSPAEDVLLLILAIAPVLIVLAFALL